MLESTNMELYGVQMTGIQQIFNDVTSNELKLMKLENYSIQAICNADLMTTYHGMLLLRSTQLQANYC